MSDFESNLKTLLNERVDAQLGPRRAAPPFATPTARQRAAQRWFGANRSRWVLPLLAAACVAGVVGGSVGAAHLLAEKHLSPAPATNGPASKHTPTPAPTHSPKPDESGTVTLAGATLPLPSGWVTRDYLRYEPRPGEGQTYGPDQGWCLTPASMPVTVGGCPIRFRPFRASAQQGPLMDVDNRGGAYGNPAQVCVPEGLAHSTEQAADRMFGGRAADWRYWRYECVAKPAFVAEQYVVATRPAYIVLSERADATVHRVLTDLAAHASLPPATSGMRYEDFGYVRRIRVAANGIRISIDRTVRDQTVDRDHTTYDYVVPNKVYVRAAKNVKVGKLAQIFTDGTRVTLLFGYSS